MVRIHCESFSCFRLVQPKATTSANPVRFREPGPFLLMIQDAGEGVNLHRRVTGRVQTARRPLFADGGCVGIGKTSSAVTRVSINALGSSNLLTHPINFYHQEDIMQQEIVELHLAAGKLAGQERTCGKKIDYKSEESATKAASKMNGKPNTRHELEAYPCCFCGGISYWQKNVGNGIA